MYVAEEAQQNSRTAIAVLRIAAASVKACANIKGATTKLFFIHCLGRNSRNRPPAWIVIDGVIVPGGLILSSRRDGYGCLMKLVLMYVLFAVTATAMNIGSQEVVVRLYSGPYRLFASVIAGTVVGLVVKYVLDKLFIFNFRSRSPLHDVQVFLQYTAVGVITTAIFWIFEFGFNVAFADKNMRYVGALIGLALGYYIKYRIDKRFVFRVQQA